VHSIYSLKRLKSFLKLHFEVRSKKVEKVVGIPHQCNYPFTSPSLCWNGWEFLDLMGNICGKDRSESFYVAFEQIVVFFMKMSIIFIGPFWKDLFCGESYWRLYTN